MIFNTTILIYILIGVIAILIGFVLRLEIKLKKLLCGKSGRSLENTIFNIANNVTKLNNSNDEIRNKINHIENRVRKSIKKAEVIRFNPFVGTGSGGNQSFATALINEDGEGIVLSSLYSRERMSVFAKPVKNYISEYELSGEEKEAIKKVKLS